MEIWTRTNIANGLLSAFILLSGIIVCAATAGALLKDEEFFRLFSLSSKGVIPIWPFGFFYVVSGLIGILASVLGNRGTYIAQLTFLIISLLVMSVAFALRFRGLFVYFRDAYRDTSCREYGCSVLWTLSEMSITVVVFYILALLASIAASVTSGILVKNKKPLIDATVIQEGTPNSGQMVSPGQGYVINQSA